MKESYTKKELIIFPLLLVLTEVAVYLANDMYLPALPQLAKELNVSNYLAQLTLSVWFFGSASMQLILGPLTDRYGRRPILLTGTLIFVVSCIACALTTRIHLFIVARLLQGATVCAVIVAGYSSIHELLSQKQAIKTLAWMNSIIVLAPAFGPLLGALVLLIDGWRLIFWFLAVWQIIVTILIFKFMPETRPQEFLHSIEIKSIIKNYFIIISNKNFILNTMSFCFVFGTMIVWIVAGPFLVIEKFHYSPLMYAVFQAMVFSSFIIATRLVNFLMHRVGIPQLVKLGMTFIFVGAVLSIPFTYIDPNWLLGLIIPLMIYTFGAGLCFAPLNRLAIEASDAPMGSRMAMFSFIMTGFAALASVYITLFYYGDLFSIGVVMVITAFISTLLGSRIIISRH